MKLLIIDDETYTRMGILNKLPLNELGIDLVEQSDDGFNGLEVAKWFKPDIIITDVRMPRMDGIEMSFKIREFLPDSIIIFISGYSDKQYLKAAINLQAISYVEKPIDIDELGAAVKKAVIMKMEQEERLKYELLLKNKLNLSMKAVENELTLNLTKQSANPSILLDYLGMIIPDTKINSLFLTVIIKPVGKDWENSKFGYLSDEICKKAVNVYTDAGYTVISGTNDDGLTIVHVCFDSMRSISEQTIRFRRICIKLFDVLSEKGNFVISCGKIVNGALKIYESYNAAILSMEKSFFYGNGVIWYDENDMTESFKFDETLLERFNDYMKSEDKQHSIALLEAFFSDIKRYYCTPVDTVKSYCCKLIAQLINVAKLMNIRLPQDTGDWDYVKRYIDGLSFLTEIEKYSMCLLNRYFNSIEEKDLKTITVNQILEYIHKKYNDSDLSLYTINKEFLLSSPYICKIFKEKTQKTVNQYITEYRIEKAKELLRDIRIKIKDVALMVGFNDVNYFTKTFKRVTGLTPLGYRETYL